MIKTELSRHIGLFALIVYGVGDMVGAGIYGTIGVAAGALGNTVWLAFGVSMIVAMLTGLSYAALGSRFPKAGGASYITKQAYGSNYLSFLVGLSVTASGLTSMAAGANVFAQTAAFFFPAVPITVIIVFFLGVLTTINLAGIKESITANLVCTTIEIGGLLLILAIGARYWGTVDYFETPTGTSLSTVTLLSGAVLTFYAFVGFEDMLNVAEETKDPVRTIPIGIITALAITTVLYIAVSITAVSVVPYQSLSDPTKGAPLAQITQIAAPWIPKSTYSLITLFAVMNTALLNYVMGSRMIFGMAREGLLPKWLYAVHPTKQTPHRAILTLGFIVLCLAFVGNISSLASATSLLLLACFCIVNGALLIIKRRHLEKMNHFDVPAIVPLGGFLTCLALIGSRISTSMTAPAPLIIAGSVIVFLTIGYFLRVFK